MALVRFDWRSIKRWSLLFTFVMAAWLMFPVARCSFRAFEDTPLPEAVPHDQTGGAPQPDDEQVAEEPGFFSKLGSSMKVCYAKTPLLGQEDWKTTLLVGFAALTVLAYAVAYYQAGRAKSFEDR